MAKQKCGGGGGLTALETMLGPAGIKGLASLGPVECSGYGLTLTPWWCIENQLSDYCLPGFPCHECEAGVTIIPPSPPLEKGGEKDRRRDARPTGDARPAHGKRKTENRKQLLRTMSRAVARDLGLI